MSELDRIIHEPVRLRIMAILSGVDRADFKFMLTTLGLSKGNLRRTWTSWSGPATSRSKRVSTASCRTPSIA